jgi:hypothetical protein
MRDYLDLSPTPVDEPCAQVGPDDYMPRMRAECRAFVSQLGRTFPEALAAGVGFRIKSNTYDAGTYLSVEACFNDDDESQTEWAYTIEGELPSLWDDEARAELTAKGFECVPQETPDFWATDSREFVR